MENWRPMEYRDDVTASFDVTSARPPDTIDSFARSTRNGTHAVLPRSGYGGTATAGGGNTDDDRAASSTGQRQEEDRLDDDEDAAEGTRRRPRGRPSGAAPRVNAGPAAPVTMSKPHATGAAGRNHSESRQPKASRNKFQARALVSNTRGRSESAYIRQV